MTDQENNAVLEANSAATKLLMAEWQAKFPEKTTKQIRALVAEEIRFRTAGAETGVDAMQAGLI